MRTTLRGLRVLVTRPQAQALGLCQALEDAGAETLTIPLLQLDPLTSDSAVAAIKRIITNLDEYQIAIFVSQNAVVEGLKWIDQYWPQMPIGIAYYAVGATTARLLRDQGFSVEAADQSMNSEALLNLEQLQAEVVLGKKVVIFRGAGGRPYLGEQLQQRGAKVVYCELYQRQLPESAVRIFAESDFGSRCGKNDDLARNSVDNSNDANQGEKSWDVVTVYSGETLTNFNRIIEQLGRHALKQLPLVVPGERVASLARELQFQIPVVAENATDASMMAALKNWYKEQL